MGVEFLPLCVVSKTSHLLLISQSSTGRAADVCLAKKLKQTSAVLPVVTEPNL